MLPLRLFLTLMNPLRLQPSNPQIGRTLEQIAPHSKKYGVHFSNQMQALEIT